MDFQKLGETLNECVNEELIIRVGRYESEEITGELFITTMSDNIFMVGSDDSSWFKHFNTIPDNAVVTPIDKDFENTPITYDEIDINNKSSLRAYFPKSEVGIEMFECVQSVPLRFRHDALDVFDTYDESWSLHDVDKIWTYFLEDMLQEMTEEEMKTYCFG